MRNLCLVTIGLLVACSSGSEDTPARCRAGYYGDGTTCIESIGQVIWMGHDFFSRNGDVDRLIGNAVAQATTLGRIQVLGYQQYADQTPTGEVANTNAAIQARAAELGRTVNITPLDDYTALAANLAGKDVLLVYEMENGGDAVAIGAAWAAQLHAFLEGGGVVIALDHYSEAWRILDAAGVMRFMGRNTGYGDTPVTVTAPADPLAADVSLTYTGTNGTASCWTNDGTIVALDQAGVPVAVHKRYARPRFSGGVGVAWELLASDSEPIFSLMTYHPAHVPHIYNMYDETGQRYSPETDTWTPLAAAGPASNPWFQMAPVGRLLYGFVAYTTNVARYNSQADTWTPVVATWAGGGANEYTMAVADESGYVYGYANNGNVLRYSPYTNTVTPLATSIPALRGNGSLYETRLAYDPPSRSLFLGGYGGPELYRYELDTGVTTQVTSIPESSLNDIFCGDRAGHIYAAGGPSGSTMWQYDIATDTWTGIPDYPMDHGNNGTCVVSDAGYLYASSGSGSELRRLPLE